MPTSRLLVSALLFLCLLPADAQVSLPYRRQAVYLLGSQDSRVQVELFVDPLCADAAEEYAMWNGPLRPRFAAADLGVSFKHIVEPFHPWSFTASVAAWTVLHTAGPNAFFNFSSSCWDHHADFITQWGSDRYVLMNRTESDVVAELAAFAQLAGVASAEFYSGLTNRSTNSGGNPWAVAREMWKEAVTRGAASSPWYFVNGVPFFSGSDALHLGADRWAALVTRLLEKQG